MLNIQHQMERWNAQALRSQGAAQGGEAQGAHEGHEFRGVQEAAAILTANRHGDHEVRGILGRSCVIYDMGFADS